MYYFAAFLPIHPAEESREKSHKLWLEEFFLLWLNLCGDIQAMQVRPCLSSDRYLHFIFFRT